MRRAARVSPLVLGVVVAVAALVVLLFMGQKSPGEAGSRFMDALARGDVDTLVKTSYSPGKSPEELRKDWEFATHTVGKHYLFHWEITSSNVVNDDSATVRLAVQRNFGPGSYDENYGLPLHKIDGEWKVDASGISREMYPALPRAGTDETSAGSAPQKA